MSLRMLTIKNLKTNREYRVTSDDWNGPLKAYQSRFTITDERVVVNQPGAVFAPQEISMAAKAAVQALEAGSKAETVNKPAKAGIKR